MPTKRKTDINLKKAAVQLNDRQKYFKELESMNASHSLSYQLHVNFITDRIKNIISEIEVTNKRTKVFMEFLEKKIDYCKRSMDIARSAQKLVEPFASPTIYEKPFKKKETEGEQQPEKRNEKKEIKQEKVRKELEVIAEEGEAEGSPEFQLPDEWKSPNLTIVFDYFEDSEFEIENQFYEAYSVYFNLLNGPMQDLVSEYKANTSTLLSECKI